MKLYIFLTILILTFNTHCQENNINLKISTIDSSLLKSEKLKDSIQSNSVVSDTSKERSDETITVLINLKDLGKIQTSGKSEFIIGLSSGFLLNFYGLVPAIITSVVPTKKSRSKVNELLEKNPDLTVKEVKNYKKGSLIKRSTKAIGGALIGSFAQTLIAVIIIIYTF